MNRVRGPKYLKLRCPLPQGYLNETVILEAKRHSINVSVENNDNKYVISKSYEHYEFDSSNAKAVVKDLKKEDAERVGYPSILEITLPITGQENAVAAARAKVAAISHVEAGETRNIDYEKAQ